MQETKAELVEHDIREDLLDELVQALHSLDKKEGEQRVIEILVHNKNFRAWLKERARKRRLRARATQIIDMCGHPDYPNLATAKNINTVFALCQMLMFEFLPRNDPEPFVPRRIVIDLPTF